MMFFGLLPNLLLHLRLFCTLPKLCFIKTCQTSKVWIVKQMSHQWLSFQTLHSIANAISNLLQITYSLKQVNQKNDTKYIITNRWNIMQPSKDILLYKAELSQHPKIYSNRNKHFRVLKDNFICPLGSFIHNLKYLNK